MTRKSIIPAIIEYMDTIATSISSLKDAGVKAPVTAQSKTA